MREETGARFCPPVRAAGEAVNADEDFFSPSMTALQLELADPGSDFRAAFAEIKSEEARQLAPLFWRLGYVNGALAQNALVQSLLDDAEQGGANADG